MPQWVQHGANEVALIAPGIATNNSSNSGENFRLDSTGTWVQTTYQTAYETIETQPQYLQPYGAPGVASPVGVASHGLLQRVQGAMGSAAPSAQRSLV